MQRGGLSMHKAMHSRQRKAAQDTKDETRHIHQQAQRVHSFYGSDMLCIKCGKYFPETNA
jgi:hypothetical protein